MEKYELLIYCYCGDAASSISGSCHGDSMCELLHNEEQAADCIYLDSLFPAGLRLYSENFYWHP